MYEEGEWLEIYGEELTDISDEELGLMIEAGREAFRAEFWVYMEEDGLDW